MRWYLRAEERRPAPPAPPSDDRRALGLGTLTWLVLLVAALVGHGWLEQTGRGWWLWACVAGTVLGFAALWRESRRRARRR